MSQDRDEKIEALLQEIKEGQKKQLEYQSEALNIQRENFSLVKAQFERANKIQDRAEKIQNSGAQLVSSARKSMFVIIPIIFLLLLFAGWLVYRSVCIVN